MVYIGWSFLLWVLKAHPEPQPPNSLPTPQLSQVDPEAVLGGLRTLRPPLEFPFACPISMDKIMLHSAIGMCTGCGEQPPQRDTECPAVCAAGNPVRKKPAQRVFGDHIYSQWGPRPREKKSPKTSGTFEVEQALPTLTAVPLPEYGQAQQSPRAVCLSTAFSCRVLCDH